jgi:hypothetical protein
MSNQQRITWRKRKIGGSVKTAHELNINGIRVATAYPIGRDFYWFSPACKAIGVEWRNTCAEPKTLEQAKADCETYIRACLANKNEPQTCTHCGADLMDGCECHESVTGFPGNCSRD